MTWNSRISDHAIHRSLGRDPSLSHCALWSGQASHRCRIRSSHLQIHGPGAPDKQAENGEEVLRCPRAQALPRGPQGRPSSGLDYQSSSRKESPRCPTAVRRRGPGRLDSDDPGTWARALKLYSAIGGRDLLPQEITVATPSAPTPTLPCRAHRRHSGNATDIEGKL